MTNNIVNTTPASYKNAAQKHQQGTVTEVTYRVQNYINPNRQLVTNQNISIAEAGRETVSGEAITKKCNIYLPAGYDKNDKSSRYNVLYLLHGVGGDRYEWLKGGGWSEDNYVICNIFDNLIANGEIEPLIIVFPDGRSACDWTDSSFRAEGTNMLGFYYFDYELRYDLMPFIEMEYNTYADIKDTSAKGIAYNRLHRAVAGLSMGGMQTLNLGLGGYRCDSTVYTETNSGWTNGLDKTVPVPGMVDLFAYAGAFSNAPTSSDGKFLGTSLAACGYKLSLLYMTCGDEDGVAYQAGYVKASEGLRETAGANLGDFYKVIMKEGMHDFKVWNNGAYNFARLAFGRTTDQIQNYDAELLLELGE